MSNPFGDDDTDFNLEAMLAGAFKNSVAILKDPRPPAGSNLDGLINPVTSTEARFTVDASKVPSAPKRGHFAITSRKSRASQDNYPSTTKHCGTPRNDGSGAVHTDSV
jgi:hypothetical protein